MVIAAFLIASVCHTATPPSRPMCTCVTGRASVKTQVREALRGADAVFTGTVVSIKDTAAPLFPDAPRSLVTFRKVFLVVEVGWKGPGLDTVAVWTGSGGGDCGYSFEVGERYLVFASARDATSLQTHICTLTQKVSGAQEYIRTLGKPRHRQVEVTPP